MAFRIWWDFFIYNLFLFFFLPLGLGCKAGGFCIMYTKKSARSLATTTPHDRLFLPRIIRHFAIRNGYHCSGRALMDRNGQPSKYETSHRSFTAKIWSTTGSTQIGEGSEQKHP